MKMFDMTGRVAIVTGGSGGIGYEAARALAEAGCNVYPSTLFPHYIGADINSDCPLV
jgi:nucleoside-diphosphate-sugar epimerase